MAEFKFGKSTEQQIATPDLEVGEQMETSEMSENITKPSNGQGMAPEELNDANKVQVSVLDKKTPIVVLFGPQACGKTMTLIRLAAYLRSQGYQVIPDTQFRPDYDKHYQAMCANFRNILDSPEASSATALLNFMLVKVILRGKTICQILEGPGEYYFDVQQPFKGFPRFVNNIINSPNRKIWAVLLEPGHTTKVMNQGLRQSYVEKVNSLKSMISPRDKVMFVFNKIDCTEFVISPGNVRTNLALEHAGYLYPGIFAQFRNMNPVTKLWKSHNCDFIPFQTGCYSEAFDGTLAYEHGHDAYPRNLWSLIVKRING